MQTNSLARGNKITVAIVISAHNEEDYLIHTLPLISQQLDRNDRLIVIADNCTDSTGTIAIDNGALLFERMVQASFGKGQALKWLALDQKTLLEEFSSIIILDADSIISDDFLRQVKTKLEQENSIYQCDVNPIFDPNSPISVLSAHSEISDQKVGDFIRNFIIWPVRLRGTGMVIPSELFIQYSQEIKTYTEDIALSLLAVSNFQNIRRIEKASLGDPKPIKVESGANQRARWFRGQIEAAKIYRHNIKKILARGPKGWFLLTAIFFRPKWLFTLVYVILLIVLKDIWAFATILWLLILFTLSPLVIGIIFFPNIYALFKAFFFVPVYIWMWLIGFYRSLKSNVWLSARTRK